MSRILSKCRRPRRAAVLVAALTPLLFGCGRGDGPDLGRVSGRVTLDGKPLPGAMVQFQPDRGRSSFGESDAGGNYELSYMPANPGAIVGPHTVRVTTSGETMIGPEAKLDTGEKSTGPAPTVKLTSERLPPRYNIKSELRKTVESGPNTLDLELTSKP